MDNPYANASPFLKRPCQSAVGHYVSDIPGGAVMSMGDSDDVEEIDLEATFKALNLKPEMGEEPTLLLSEKASSNNTMIVKEDEEDNSNIVAMFWESELRQITDSILGGRISDPDGSGEENVTDDDFGVDFAAKVQSSIHEFTQITIEWNTRAGMTLGGLEHLSERTIEIWEGTVEELVSTEGFPTSFITSDPNLIPDEIEIERDDTNENVVYSWSSTRRINLELENLDDNNGPPEIRFVNLGEDGSDPPSPM